MATYTASTRLFSFHCSMGSDALLVKSFKGRETVSEPFFYEIDLLSEKDEIDFNALVGKPAFLEISMPEGSFRYVHGIISSFSQVSSDTRFTAYKGVLVPMFQLLRNRATCRIFQDKNIPEIIKKVFDKTGFTVKCRFSLQEKYEPRKYCVQYRETDFDFVSRLMEEEGIFYFFEHTKDDHTMVLGDNPVAHPKCWSGKAARFGKSENASLHDDLVFSFVYTQSIRPGYFSHVDYDFSQPGMSLLTTTGSEKEAALEIFDYPGRYTAQSEGDRLAKVRLQELKATQSTIRGTGECRFFQAGHRFKLTEHPRKGYNSEYLLTSVSQSGSQGEEFGDYKNMELNYSNEFECIQSSIAFRPARITPRPKITGIQSAIVVGPKTDEIYVDQHGRVKVQFHWDREGLSNEKSSCWIRVAQNQAGSGWGGMFIPRIGQEVLISFLNGDPDRPVVVGSVYNGENKTPYTLPAEKTKSTLKSNSSKGGKGFNEIRFEDLKGSEEVFVHAQKNLDVRVKNDRKEWLGNDGHLLVKRDSLETVERDKHVQIKRDEIAETGRDRSRKTKGKEAVEITGSRSVTVQGDVTDIFKSNHCEQVSRDYYVKGTNVVIEAMTGLTLKVGGSFITLDASGVSITGPLVKINSGGAALSGKAQPAAAPAAPIAADEAADGSAGAPAK